MLFGNFKKRKTVYMIRVQSLSYTYSQAQTPALQSINFQLIKGEILGITGRQGSGKSTLLRILAGNIRNYSGTVFYRDKDYLNWSRDFYESVAVSFAKPGLFPKLTVLENLQTFAGLYQNKDIALKNIPLLLEKLNLNKSIKKRIQELSPNLQKLVDIVRVLLPNPTCAFLEEPFMGQHEIDIGLIQNILRQQKIMGNSVVISTLNSVNFQDLCDRWIILEQGHIAGTGENK